MKLFLNESEEFDFPLEDGTSEELLKEFEKEKKENEKELNKYIDDAEKIIDDVNKSDEKIYVKELTEKLILEEVDLEEAIPRPLANAMKNPRRGARDNTSPRSYKYISDTSKNSSVDFEKSTYTEITPAEAIQYKKDGRLNDILIVYDGQLVNYKDEKHQQYRAERRSGSANNLYHRPNGDWVDSTTKLTFKTIVDNADHIYLKDEVDYDTTYDQTRGGSYDSPRFSRFSGYLRGRSPAVNYSNSSWWSNKGDLVRGGSTNPTLDTTIKSYKSRIRNSKINIETYQARLEEYKNKINEIKLSLAEKDVNDFTEEELNALVNQAKRDIDYYKRQVEYQKDNIKTEENRIKDYENDIKKVKTRLKDAKARFRYANSEIDLTKVYDEFKQVKNDLAKFKDNIDNYTSRKTEIETSGTPEARRLRDKIASYKESIANYEKMISDFEDQLSQISDEKEIKELEANISAAGEELNNARAKFNKMLGRKNESLTEALDTLTETGDYEDLRPEGHLAKKIYALIIGSEKLDEMVEVLKELFPEGISLTGLWDILNFDPYFILEELEIEIPDDLIKNLEPDEGESDYEEEEIKSDESEEEPEEEDEA